MGARWLKALLLPRGTDFGLGHVQLTNDIKLRECVTLTRGDSRRGYVSELGVQAKQTAACRRSRAPAEAVCAEMRGTMDAGGRGRARNARHVSNVIYYERPATRQFRGLLWDYGCSWASMITYSLATNVVASQTHNEVATDYILARYNTIYFYSPSTNILAFTPLQGYRRCAWTIQVTLNSTSKGKVWCFCVNLRMRERIQRTQRRFLERK
ncbi:hypothetical protein EVAR_30799_1 [Eumeta japonica]|uniref:Uncharacterized protein n=1 Tax=Eumeta variegata TaxID=151549 RepID=A0A4C1V943_EUMVA|nr:hypothetical protein EVAR_30799_1 [Eumeta japonica]